MLILGLYARFDGGLLMELSQVDKIRNRLKAAHMTDISSMLDEIARDLPTWRWSIRANQRIAEVMLETDNAPRQSIIVGNIDDVLAVALRLVIDRAKMAPLSHGLPATASLHLLSYERRIRQAASLAD